MKSVLKTGILVLLVVAATSISSVAQDREQMKRGVGPASFFLSIKDKLGLSKEQEDKLITIESNALKKLDEITPVLVKTQQLLNSVTKEEEIDLAKTKEILKNMAILDTDARYTMIEAVALEKKVLTKEQLKKAQEIAAVMPRGPAEQPGKK